MEQETPAISPIILAKEETDLAEILGQGGLSHFSLEHLRTAAQHLEQALSQLPSAEDETPEDKDQEVLRLASKVMPQAQERIQAIAQDSWPEDINQYNTDRRTLRRFVGFSYYALSKRSEENKESLSEVKGVTLRQLISKTFAALAVLALLVVCGAKIKDAYKGTIPPRIDLLEENYHALFDLGLPESFAPRPVLWLEFGKDGRLITTKQARKGFMVSLRRFSVGDPWSRAIHWHVAAGGHGAVTLQFPPESAKAVALFMTDGDSFFRASRVGSDLSDFIAESLHNGRWYILPVTDEEQKNGTKEIRFNQLAGSNIALSTMLVF